MATWKPCPFAGPKYDPFSLMRPLMRNWTEPLVEKRDKYDYDYGCGVGMIDDNITYEYRMKKNSQEQAEKNKKTSTKISTVSGKKKESNTSQASASNVMERIWHELKEIRKEMRRLPELCARRMIEKMNKTGVFYRTGKMEKEEENLYDDINESTNDGAFSHKEFVYQSDKDYYRTPSQGKINKQKDDDEDEKAVTSLDTNEISSHGSGNYNGVDEQVEKEIGKHKRTASRAIKSPFVVVKPIKRAKRSAKAKLFNKVDGKKTSADAYMALNKDNTHWVTVVVHKEKEEFQVPDSLMGKELNSTTRELVEDLRREIGEDIAEANATESVQYPDVSTRAIKTYDMPQQEDGNSCELFVLHCFKNWNGDTWDRSFSQMADVPETLLETGFPLLLVDCLEKCHVRRTPIFLYHEHWVNADTKEYHVDVIVKANDSPSSWFFEGPQMGELMLVVETAAREALVQLRNILP
ncbi:hypothetical protein D1007_23664 [Hordeum vulgare]|nr:hypothetical protein D1007_23664 [Hordeum vulgare]